MESPQNTDNADKEPNPQSDHTESADAQKAADLLKQMIEAMSGSGDGDTIGGSGPNKEPQIDITLYPSRETPIAGELWSVSAEVHNRDQKPIWLVDTTSCLSLAPEMYGQGVSTGSVGAFLPTIKPTPAAQVIRIDPNAKYTLIWKLDPLSGDTEDTIEDLLKRGGKRQQPKKRTLLRRVIFSLRNYMFFVPGRFRVSCTCHVWLTPPKPQGRSIENMGESFAMTVTKDIEMEASPWVLIFGAAAGAAMSFALQVLSGRIALDSSFFGAAQNIFVGLTSATILAGVATVLLARLASTDFLVVIRIRDFWGAVATGFAIQWLGYSLLDKIIRS